MASTSTKGKGRSRKKIASGALLVASVLLMAIVPDLIILDSNTNANGAEHRLARQLAGTDDHARNDSPLWKYAYVIVTYHKAGHVLSRTLGTYLRENFAFHLGGQLPDGARVQGRRDLDARTGCTDLALRPGTVTVIDAPEFHCNKTALARLFMANPDPAMPKWGVKVVHLVRNPFSMAVSNYHYHRQDPTPEPFVHRVDPCAAWNGKRLGPGGAAAADLALPIRTRTQTVLTRRDYDALGEDCSSLYRTRPGLANATYFEHLRALDPGAGLRLATADKFRHFFLMSQDLVLFGRVLRWVQARNAHHPAQHHSFEVRTMPVDAWIELPDRSMHEFLDFMFGRIMPEARKTQLAARYKKEYLAKSLRSEHITAGKNGDTADLIDYLRGDAAFGGPLARIEALLHEVLKAERAEG